MQGSPRKDYKSFEAPGEDEVSKRCLHVERGRCTVRLLPSINAQGWTPDRTDLDDTEPTQVVLNSRDGDVLSRLSRQVDALEVGRIARAGPSGDGNTVDRHGYRSGSCCTLVHRWLVR